MSKKARIQQERLNAMESEFQILLPECLVECARGGGVCLVRTHALTRRSDIGHGQRRKHLRELASDIRRERSNAGEVNPLVERFLEMCGAGKPNAEGEPKLASRLLQEIGEQS